MNKHVSTRIFHSGCPHDCPSTCSLEVEVIDRTSIGRVRGAKAQTYTDGVICAKVARYAERVAHPDRLLEPRIRKGSKGDGDWGSINWNDALDLIAGKFTQAEQRYGSETVWPYFYAGTMGLVQRDSIHRLRHAKKYSGQFDTICINNAFAGYSAATGKMAGPDPREMAKADCVVIWGTNAVSTQVNVMTHAMKARKQRGAKIVAIDVYMNDTMKQADLALLLKPGTDGALACAVMHILLRDGHADRDYLSKYSDFGDDVESHLHTRTPQWASAITGLSVEDIEAFARLVGETKATFFRLGYGFTRSRNGATAMHAAACIPTITGGWQVEGGGAFFSNAGIYGLDSSEIKGSSYLDPDVRVLDQSAIGRVLTGDPEVLYGGPPVTAMLVQNTNPVCVAPEQERVKAGFARDDLFVAVHEQFMTETAQVADVVLPATMFVEHDDIYRGGGNQHIVLGPKLIDGPVLCRSNHFVLEELAKRLGVSDMPGFGRTENELIDNMLRASNRGTLAQLQESHWIDCQPPFEDAHYLNGFGHADGLFHFKPDWHEATGQRPPDRMGLLGPVDTMPRMPDHWDAIETADEAFPYRLATSPARSFLNTTFNATASSRKREGRPEVMMHPDAARSEGLEEGDKVRLINERGAVVLHLKLFDGLKPDVLIAEGLHRNTDHESGRGINTLTGADATAPHGGAAFHDVKVRVEKVAE